MIELIKTLAEKLILPEYLVEEASTIYNDNLNLFKSPPEKAKNLLKTASLLLACRINDIPRTIKDFEVVGNIYRRDLFKTYTKLLRTDKYVVGVTNPIIYLNRITSRLNVDMKTLRGAENILTKKSEICSLVGSDPMLRAGSVLYVLYVKNNGEGIISQRDIAEACGGTTVTVMNQVKKLRKAGIGC